MSKDDPNQKEAQGTAPLVLWTYLAVAAVVVAALAAGLISSGILLKNARSEKDISVGFESYESWPMNIQDTFRNTLVHEGGRVKPVHSFARFTLMRFSGKSTVKFETADEETHSVTAVSWLLDVLFRGDKAREIPVFVVDDSAVVTAIGVAPKEKRDRYSYVDLIPGRAKLAELGGLIQEKQKNYEESEKDRRYELTREEGMILQLANNVSSFEFLLGQFGFARNGKVMPNTDFWPPELKEMAAQVNAVEMLEKMPELSGGDPEKKGFDHESMDRNQWRSGLFGRLGREIQRLRQNPQPTEDARLFEGALSLMFFYAGSGQNFSIFPPADGEGREWLSAGDFLIGGLESKEFRPAAMEELRTIEFLVNQQDELWAKVAEAKKGGVEKSEEAIEELVANAAEPFATALTGFSTETTNVAQVRGEGGKAALEVHLYQRKYFMNGLVFFILGFVLLAFSWLSPGSKAARWLTRGALAFALIGLSLDVIGIVIRSIIRSRPPITNLYDTVLFITAVVVLVALLLEWVNRRGIGLMVAIVCGVGGMFLSIRYEAKEGTDTMDPLQAVLDTNFWLATHVTAINVGYAAGLLAAILAIVYLVGRFFLPFRKVIGAVRGKAAIESGDVFKLPKEKRQLYGEISRMIYGVVCFCLFFALVGTVLGGIWANYSWGRFWGWDPKENGALMICLWSLVILHGRMGGYLREIGIAVASVLLGVIVTFSWWGVNNLGVGLHSYGFTEGVWPALFVSWGAASVVMLCGLPLWLAGRSRGKKTKEPPVQAPEGDEEIEPESNAPSLAETT